MADPLQCTRRIPTREQRSKHVRPKSEVGLVFGGEMISDQVGRSIEEVVGKMLSNRGCCLCPAHRRYRVTHRSRELRSGTQLLIPQRLDIVSTGAPGRIGGQVRAAPGIHPRLSVFMNEVTGWIGPVSEGSFDAGENVGVKFRDDRTVAGVHIVE